MLQNKTIDRFDREKLYIQLTRLLLDEIHSGHWQIGQQIPTEEDLCKRYAVSKITVRQAVVNLVSDGYLTKIQGKGSFVAGALPVIGLAMKTRLTEEVFGKEVTFKKKILFKRVIAPSREVKTYLKTGDRIYYILIRRTANDKTAYVEEAFIPYNILPGAEKLDFAGNSLYSVLQEKGIKKIFKMIQTIEIARTRREYAKYLGVKDGLPVLVVHRLFLGSDNTPVAYTRLQGGSKKYKFQAEFERIR